MGRVCVIQSFGRASCHMELYYAPICAKVYKDIQAHVHINTMEVYIKMQNDVEDTQRQQNIQNWQQGRPMWD